MSDILDRAETILTNARSEWSVRSVQAAMALDLLPELIAEIKRQAAYVARLEAAYQEAETFRLFDSRDGDTTMWDCEQRACKALERIKRGEKE